MIRQFPVVPGPRQIFELDIELVLRSCGFGVPQYELKQTRQTLVQWANDKGEDGIAQYWREKNQLSLDDKPTGILD